MDMITDRGIRFILDDNLAKWRPAFISAGAPVKQYAPGTIMSQSGTIPERIFFLLEGLVKVYTSSVNGNMRLVGYHKPNTLFVLDGLRGKEPSVVTTEAITEITVVPLDQNRLRSLLKAEPELETDLLFYVSDVLRLMCYEAESQSGQDVRDRVISFLSLYLQSSGGDLVPLSQENLASAINASRVQTSRVCEELAAQGRIEIGRKRIRVRDPRLFGEE